MEQRPRFYRSTMEYALIERGLIYDTIICTKWNFGLLTFHLHRYEAADCRWNRHFPLCPESIDSISLSVRPWEVSDSLLRKYGGPLFLLRDLAFRRTLETTGNTRNIKQAFPHEV